MSVFSFLRPKFKHPDPAVRAAAVARLTHQALLAKIVSTDLHADVRAAALRQINDEDIRSEVAMADGPMNIAALEGVTAPDLLESIARNAASPKVRWLAVARIESPQALAVIAASDLDDEVRRLARSRHRRLGGVHQHLRDLLSRLRVIEGPATGATAGSLDDVCAAVANDGRFQIDAVISAPEGTSAATTEPASDSSDCVELLARTRDDTGVPPGGTVRDSYYQIRIWRRGEDRYGWQIARVRRTITKDVVSWAASSRG